MWSLIAACRPSRSSGPVVELARRRRPAWRGWCGWRGAGCRAAGCRGRPRARPAGRPACRRRCRSCGPLALAVVGGPSVLARISARCIGRTPVLAGSGCRRCASGRSCRPRTARRRPVDRDVAHLVGAHRRRDVGVLDARRCRRSRSTPRRRAAPRSSRPLTAAQQPAGPVAEPEHPQRVAGGVVGDGVREVRADVGRPRARRPGTRSARTSSARPPRPRPRGRRRGPRRAPARRSAGSCRAPSRRTNRTA